jgi:hypothetical protein
MPWAPQALLTIHFSALTKEALASTDNGFFRPAADPHL